MTTNNQMADKKYREFDLYFTLDDDGTISPYDCSICENAELWKPNCGYAEPNIHVIEHRALVDAEEKIKGLHGCLEKIDWHIRGMYNDKTISMKEMRKALKVISDGLRELESK